MNAHEWSKKILLSLTLLFSLAAMGLSQTLSGGDSRSRSLEISDSGDPPDGYAYVKAIDDIMIPAEAAGKIVALPVREGGTVREGDEVTRLSNTDAKLQAFVAWKEFQAAEEEAKNDIKVRASEAASKVKDAELNKALEVNKTTKDAVTAMEVERMRLDAVHAKLQTEQSEFQFDVAKITMAVQEGKRRLANHEYHKRNVKSPLNGVVVRYEKHIGEWVNIGEPILRLMRLDRLHVTRLIYARDYAPHTMMNRPVEIVVRIGDQIEKVSGTVSYVEPELASDQSYMIRAEIENRMSGDSWLMYPGMQAEMKVLGP